MGSVPWGKMAQTCRGGAGSGGWDCHHMAALGSLAGGVGGGALWVAPCLGASSWHVFKEI